MEQFKVPSNFRLIAHRGASGECPENSAAAFLRAIQLGAKEIELDLRLTSDRQVVIVHDASLERYQHGTRKISDCSLVELKALDFGSWFHSRFSGERILTLAELFELCGAQVIYHLELKGRDLGLAEAVSRSIERLRVDLVIRSFSIEMLSECRRLAPGAKLGLLVKECEQAGIDQAAQLAAIQISAPAKAINESWVNAAKQRTLEVLAWDLGLSNAENRSWVEELVKVGVNGAAVDWLEGFVVEP